MNPERWTTVETICDQALHLDAPERTAFLDRACAGDKALRSEVQSLLDQLDNEVRSLQKPIVTFSRSGDFAGLFSGSPTHVGPYRLIRTIAAGGMGEVYLALRDDDAFSRYVAVKVIRRGFGSADIRNRFVNERQILASLNHPNIARLFDGGTTDDGLLWYAMEYIDGTPITEYCEQRDYSVRKRLHLFLDVCSAVRYAHQNLIVHCDLKPGNILVTPAGEIKLLDFGIAKMLEQYADSKQTAVDFDGNALTPEYASPEQSRNVPVSTVSDVYSLGVVLYELLTGKLPENGISNNESILRSFPDETSLPEDLKYIVAMALRIDPSERYSSVEQFADDINRYLRGEPVIARAPTVWYLGRKFITRHRWSAGITAAFAVLIIGFGVIAFIQTTVIKAGAERVEQERDRAEQISEFLIDLFESAEPSEADNASITAHELIRRGASRVESELADQPELQSEMFFVISRVYERLGRYLEAEETARKSYDMRIALYGDRHADVATALHSLGWIYFQQGKLAIADSVLQEVLRIRREIRAVDDPNFARALNDLAVVKQARDDYRAADSLLVGALRIRRNLFGDDHESVGVTLSNYAALKWKLGELSEAESLMREVLQLLEARLGKDDLRVAVAMTNLAALLTAGGDLDEAEKLYREALAIRYKLVGEEHPDVAYSLDHLGNILRYKGEFEEARTVLEKSLTIRLKLLGKDHVLLGNSNLTLALLYDQMGDTGRAEERYIDAVGIFRKRFSDDHTRVAETLYSLGDFYLRTERADAAEPVLREALDIWLMHFGHNHVRIAQTKILLGSVLNTLRRSDEARSMLTSGLEYLENHPDNAKYQRFTQRAERLLAGL